MDAIVFVVDASDQERIDESRKELAKVLNDKYISSVPVLILGNKIDKPDVLSEDQLKNCLGISEITTGKNQADLLSRPLELFMCSVMRRQGWNCLELSLFSFRLRRRISLVESIFKLILLYRK